MNWRLDIKGWRFYVALTHSVKVRGVNSKLPSGKHILMWDFDNIGEVNVKDALSDIQRRFRLPKIYLINTGLKDYWHAYCFKAMSYPDCLRVLATTKYLDQVYFKIGVIRGYFTLRYSPKKDRDFEPAIILPSRYKEDVNPYELCSFIKYWTKRL